jgi:hypothetical protein
LPRFRARVESNLTIRQRLLVRVEDWWGGQAVPGSQPRSPEGQAGGRGGRLVAVWTRLRPQREHQVSGKGKPCGLRGGWAAISSVGD